MRTTGIALLLCGLLAGCGGEAESEPDVAASVSPADETATAEEPATGTTTLAETCPEMEAALPGSGASVSEWHAYRQHLDALSEAGDTETQNAVRLLVPAVDDMAADPEGMDLLDARASLRDALDTLMNRCSAAGSSAFQ